MGQRGDSSMEKKPTPPERLVATLPLAEAKKEGQRLYGNASDYALLTFRNAMQEMLDLGWPVAHIAAQVLSFCDARLDPKLNDEIQAELDVMADDEDKEEEDDEDDDNF
jgi:hypothetical protein